MQEVSHNPYRLTLVSDSGIDNMVVIELDPDSGDIVLTFTKDPNNPLMNNKVVLDIDGNLYGGYFAAFRGLFDGLRNTPSRSPRILTRMRNLFPNKKR